MIFTSTTGPLAISGARGRSPCLLRSASHQPHRNTRRHSYRYGVPGKSLLYVRERTQIVSARLVTACARPVTAAAALHPAGRPTTSRRADDGDGSVAPGGDVGSVVRSNGHLIRREADI